MIDEQLIKNSIRTIPNFPKQGIMFRDITTLLQDPKAFNEVNKAFYEHYKDKKIDVVVGIESRGFVFGAILAEKLNCSLVLARKSGKLPYDKITEEYDLEYGKSAMEIHKDSIKEGDNVLIVDDLVATGGTALAACNLIERLKGRVVECAFVVDLPELKGKEKLKDYSIFTLVEFEGE